MPIRDVSGWPDDRVPDWVRRHRERARALRRQEAFRKKDWERIKREIEELK